MVLICSESGIPKDLELSRKVTNQEARRHTFPAWLPDGFEEKQVSSVISKHPSLSVKGCSVCIPHCPGQSPLPSDPISL